MLDALLYIVLGFGTTAVILLVFRRTRRLGVFLAIAMIFLEMGTLLAFEEARHYGILFIGLSLGVITLFRQQNRKPKPKRKRKRGRKGISTRFYDEDGYENEQQTPKQSFARSAQNQPQRSKNTRQGNDFWSRYTPKGVTYNADTDSYTLSQSLMLSEGQFVLPKERQHPSDKPSESNE